MQSALEKDTKGYAFAVNKRSNYATYFWNNAPWKIAILLALLSLFVAYGISQGGLQFTIIALIVFVGVPMMIYSSANLHFGVYLTFVISFFILGIMRFINAPLGIAMDALLLYYFLAVVVHVGRTGSWEFAKNGVGMLVLAWMIYNIAQVANPWAESRLAWVYTIRGMAGALVFFYICLYAFKNYNQVKIFIQMWIFLSLLLSVYALIQEFKGLADFEIQWIKADEERYKLFYNWGRYRKCSFFSDPTTFGMTASYSSLLCLVLSLGPINFFKRAYYLVAAGIMAFSMLYSGTRTAYVLIPAGIAFITVLTLKKEFVIPSILFFILGAGIIFSPIRSIGPLDENALTRLRSAFMPEDDPSFQVRLKNQAFIKPFIQTHPIGAGLGSVGDWGERFSPWSPLAGFPPDSGFVKIAVELGWLGMILYCTMLFVLLRTGIRNYHQIKDPFLKSVQAALLAVMFCLIIANYAQEAITMYPTSIIFYACMAIVVLMPKFETNEN